jgi:hypothetical protein
LIDNEQIRKPESGRVRQTRSPRSVLLGKRNRKTTNEVKLRGVAGLAVGRIPGLNAVVSDPVTTGPAGAVSSGRRDRRKGLSLPEQEEPTLIKSGK